MPGSATKEEILDFLRENKNLFRKKFGVKSIMLFGSYARDEATEESNIDIAIEHKEKSFDNLFNVKEILENKFKKSIRVVYIDSIRTYILRFVKEEMIYA